MKLEIIYRKSKKMKILITADELSNRGKWGDFCELRNINPWAKNEGLVYSDEKFELTEDEAEKLDIIKKNRGDYL